MKITTLENGPVLLKKEVRYAIVDDDGRRNEPNPDIMVSAQLQVAAKHEEKDGWLVTSRESTGIWVVKEDQPNIATLVVYVTYEKWQ